MRERLRKGQGRRRGREKDLQIVSELVVLGRLIIVYYFLPRKQEGEEGPHWNGGKDEKEGEGSRRRLSFAGREEGERSAREDFGACTRRIELNR